MPERLDAFMARANAAYYATRDPFADFTTAPEIAQMFGELIGAWAATVWRMLGAPDPVLLAEAGPGRGTLMQDARRATARVAPAFHAAARIHLIETSPRLRGEQAARLPVAVWHDSIDGLPPGPAIVIANEFLDALPIRQFVGNGGGGDWAERYVSGGEFIVTPTPHAPKTLVPPGGDGLWAGIPPGGVVEIGEAALAWTGTLALRLASQGGACLILDYGPADSGPGDTLQALRGGKPADPLDSPGQADLTAHVDFAAHRRAAEAAGAAVWGPVPQGRFLEALGLRARTGRLIAANPQREAGFLEAADRLAGPARMGSLFKALCLTQAGLSAPPGFA